MYRNAEAKPKIPIRLLITGSAVRSRHNPLKNVRWIDLPPIKGPSLGEYQSVSLAQGKVSQMC